MKTNLFKKTLALLLSVLIVVGLMACGVQQETVPTNAPQQGEVVQNPDKTAAPVTLSMVLYGSEGADSQRIVAALNEKLLKDLNVQLEPVWLGSTDSASQMSLMFSAGEEMDLVYIANWFGYKDYASKNAYAELTMEEIETYAPLSYAAISDAEWLQTKVNGKIYCVPEKTDQTTNDRCVIIRGDLREKYGMGPLEDWDDLLEYLDKALADENEAFSATGGMEGWQSHLLRDLYGWAVYDTNTGLWYDLNDVNAGKYEIFNIVQTEEFMTMCKTLRSYYEKGYWAADAVANYSSANAAENITQMDSGIVPMASTNFKTATSTLKTFQNSHPDWDLEVYGLNDDALSSARSAINDGMAIANTSKHKTLCLQVIDLLRNDPSYHHLLIHGVEGTDWEYANDSKTTFNALKTYDFGCNWGFFNADAELLDANTPEDMAAIKADWAAAGRTINNPLHAFTFDKTGYETEMALLADVYTEYYWPLYYGMHEDVEAAVAEFQDAMNAAGLETVLEAVNQQLDNFAKENNLK